jgi:hypothetical protein
MSGTFRVVVTKASETVPGRTEIFHRSVPKCDHDKYQAVLIEAEEFCPDFEKVLTIEMKYEKIN